MSHFTPADWHAILSRDDTKLDGPASDADLAGFERATGLVLPQSYKEFLRRGNGGLLADYRLFGVNRSDMLNLRRQAEENRPELEATSRGAVLPFASDWGGCYFCFNLDAGVGGEYPVLFWNFEYAEEAETRHLVWSVVADDFVAFVRRVVAA